MPYDCIPQERSERGLVESISHQSHSPMNLGIASVGRHNARTLLPPMLESIEPKIRKMRSVWMAENPENPTLFSWTI